MNKRTWCLILICLLMASGCGGVASKRAKEQLVAKEDTFTFADKNGEFRLKASAGYDKNTKTYMTKKSLEIPGRGKNGILEQSVASSVLGTVKKKTTILRPKSSTYAVWFEGKKYSSELRMNVKKKAIDVKMASPESQWNGEKQIKFPHSKIAPCFFSQLIECAKVAGFIRKASDEKKGVMNFTIVWEGYPYMNETLSDFPSELFSDAELEYDGVTKEGERRFNLKVAGQSIFYVIDEQDTMVKMFWVSQGISVISQSAKNGDSKEGEAELE